MAAITLNHAEVGRILRSAGVRAELTRRMQPVLARAIADAPVATGEYQASLHIEQATTDRAVVRVVAGTDHARVVEANTGCLARALDAAGGA